MFLDPFTFTPPCPEVLTRAVESYQRVAAARFCRYARDAEDPFLFPKYVRGDTLEPTSKQLHGEVRVLRHLTAIQRTLREIAGPAFDPDSPIPPKERFRLVNRRLDAIEEAFGDPDAPQDSSPDDRLRPDQRSSESLVARFDDHEMRRRPLRLENSSSSDRIGAHRCPSVDKTPFYYPPEIEDLLEAVNFAQIVFASRAELLDKRRLELSHEDFLLEIASLRDLTAVVRTLRRMSARPLPERQTHEDFQKEFAPETCAASSLGSPSARSASSDPPRSHAEVDADLDDSPHASFESEESEESVKSVDDSFASLSPGRASEISNPKSEIPNPSPSHPSHPSSPSHASSESVESVKSVDSSSSSDPSGSRAVASREGGPADLVAPVGVASSRPVPRVPEVRTITPRRNGATPPSQPDANNPVAPPAPAPASSIPNPQAEIPQAHPPLPSDVSESPDPSSDADSSHRSYPSHAPPVLHDKDPP